MRYSREGKDFAVGMAFGWQLLDNWLHGKFEGKCPGLAAVENTQSLPEPANSEKNQESIDKSLLNDKSYALEHDFIEITFTDTVP